MTDYIDIDEAEGKQRLDDIVWLGGGKKPLWSQVMVGYMLAKAVHAFVFFADRALSCIDMGVDDMNADGSPTSHLEAAKIKAMIIDLKGDIYEREKLIHALLSKGAKDKGYGEVTNPLFVFLGIGVVRKT